MILQQLQSLPIRLRYLASQLHHDEDIQERIIDLVHDGNEAVTAFRQIMKVSGDEILTAKNRLMKVDSPADVTVNTFRQTLKDTRISLEREKMKIVYLQTKIHTAIEESNRRKKEHQTAKRKISISLHAIPEDIQQLASKIKEYEKLIKVYYRRAEEMEQTAYMFEREANNKGGGGIVLGILGGIIGAVLAPFTGMYLHSSRKCVRLQS